MSFQFARMPRPILKDVNIIKIINKSLDFVKLTSKNTFNLKNQTASKTIYGDEDQLNRVLSI